MSMASEGSGESRSGFATDRVRRLRRKAGDPGKKIFRRSVQAIAAAGRRSAPWRGAGGAAMRRGSHLLCSAGAATDGSMSNRSDITELLNAAHSGDAGAQDAAYRAIYDELKGCARRQSAATPGSSLTPTALVSELYLKL